MTPTTKQISSFAQRLVRRAERIVYPMGKTVECPYCGWTGWRFLTSGDAWKPNRLCPGCSSLERYRMLALWLERELGSRPSLNVLEIAPKPCVTRFCQNKGWQYTSSDLKSPLAMVHADLREMPMADNTYDLIVVFHVMEHIEDDMPAYREIRRMLKPDGVAVINVPLMGDRTQEGAPKSEWTRLYGQADHVRMYGMDVVDRMKAAGLAVTTLDMRTYFSERDQTRYALRGDDRYFFIVRKS